jgi:hypothetical protein
MIEMIEARVSFGTAAADFLYDKCSQQNRCRLCASMTKRCVMLLLIPYKRQWTFQPSALVCCKISKTLLSGAGSYLRARLLHYLSPASVMGGVLCCLSSANVCRADLHKQIGSTDKCSVSARGVSALSDVAAAYPTPNTQPFLCVDLLTTLCAPYQLTCAHCRIGRFVILSVDVSQPYPHV